MTFSTSTWNLVCFILTLLICSCGVKSPPVPPKGTSIPSVIDQYKERDKPDQEKSRENKDDQ